MNDSSHEHGVLCSAFTVQGRRAKRLLFRLSKNIYRVNYELCVLSMHHTAAYLVKRAIDSYSGRLEREQIDIFYIFI